MRIGLWALLSMAMVAASVQAAPQLRGPIAVEFLREGHLACIANQKSGSLMLVDIDQHQVVCEIPAGQAPADLLVHPRLPYVFLVDAGASEVFAFRVEETQLIRVTSCELPNEPVRMTLSEDGRSLFVSCLWARCVVEVQIDATSDGVRLKRLREIEVPVAARELVLLEDHGKMLVADSFSGKIAVVDLDAGNVESVREIVGHNLRGMTRHQDRILVTQQVLNPLSPTTRDNIIWSVLMTNCVRSLSLQHLLDANANSMSQSRFIPLGTIGRGAGDPAAMAVGPEGQMLVCLSGVHQVALLSPDGRQEGRVLTGTRPIDIAMHPQGRGYLVVSHFSDTLTWITDANRPAPDDQQEGKEYAVPETSIGGRYRYPAVPEHIDGAVQIPLGDAPELSLVEVGEQLFYDATLSHDRWMSCHSCHTDGHTNGGQADTLGDGDYGASKQIMSLLGVAHSKPWAWNGSMVELREQIRKSIETSMRGREATDQQLNAIEAYLQTLSPPPVPQRSLDSQLVEEGERLFEQRGCRQCHEPEPGADLTAFDVGLTDELGQKRFNPPFLEGVSQRERLLHDGRAASVRQVLEEIKHPDQNALPPAEVDALVEYLRSL